MILKRYGTSYHSVEPNFNSRALTEIAFRRDRQLSVPVEEFESGYEKVDEHALVAETEGDVQDDAEEALLESLGVSLEGVHAALADDQVLVLESKEGEDYPKTRNSKKNVVVEGENRLYFYCKVDPPLRMGVYRKT